MSNHTPGPWQKVIFVQHELQTEFAMVRFGDRVSMIGYTDEDKANASLIAAAPELLDALKGLLALDDEHQRCEDDQDVCIEVREARAAIAKAEGGAV